MTDVYDAETRSRVMSHVRGRDTKPEMQVRKVLHAAGYRFRLHRKDLPGKPDIVLPTYHLAVFVNGCFWHGHGCKRSRRPQSNADYWSAKIERNMARDAENQGELAQLGWRMHLIWTCDVTGGTEGLLALLRSLRVSRESKVPPGC